MISADIWERFSEDLGRFIHRRIANEQDAEDVLQDVFLKIHANINTLHNEEFVAPWIYRIARNTITDYYRSIKPTVELPETIQTETDNGDDEEVISQLATGLNELINELPEIYRQPLVLSEIEGMKQAEVAVHLGLSHSGAKSRIQRGRAMLKQALLDCCHFEFDRRGAVIDYYPRQVCCAQCT